jgi:hypothetical protein
MTLPEGWEGGGGTASDTHYTRFYYHEDWELRVYWDKGHDHTVILHPEDGHYPEESHKRDTEDAAHEKAKEVMERHA